MDCRLVLSDLEIINFQFLLAEDNDVTFHLTLGDFQK